jgi:hypothetical protein
MFSGFHLQKKMSDVYFTRPGVATELVNALFDAIDLSTVSLIVEPSAGAGAFCDAIDAALDERNISGSLERCYIDITPASPKVQRVDDFLTWCPPQTSRDTVVIGNPPFGNHACMAVRFFNRAAEFASVIAFIFPQALDTRTHFLSRQFERLTRTLLPVDSFVLPSGELYDVVATWQVWRRKSDASLTVTRLRRSPQLDDESNSWFRFVVSGECNLRVGRVGCRAGRFYWGSAQAQVPGKSSYHFVQFRGEQAEKIQRALQQRNFSLERPGGRARYSLSRQNVLDALLDIIPKILAETVPPRTE